MSKQEVYDRDGGKCFFCGIPLTFEEATHEHLVATSLGGTNHNANCTIACKPCNLAAGAMTVVDKVALREAKLFPEGKKKSGKKTVLTVGDIKIEINEAPHA